MLGLGGGKARKGVRNVPVRRKIGGWLKIGGRVLGGVGGFHFVCRFESRTDLDQGTLADAGAIAGGFGPGAAVGDEFGPEGEEAALDGFHGVDGAATVMEEVTLSAFWFAEAQAVAGTDDVAVLELLGRE